jgi:cold shock protein
MLHDLVVDCAECGTPFVWTPAEQELGEQRPALCPACRLVAPQPGRRRGVIKWFSRSRGYGFITPTAGPELFVHKSGLAPGQSFPQPGQLVEFEMVTTQRGIQAEDIVVLQTPE